jgi:hypothetical protein
MKRLLVGIGGTALALTLGLAALTGSVFAQDTATPETDEETTTSGDDFVGKLAENLGISTEELEAAIDDTQTEMIDQWADEAKERVENGEPLLPWFGDLIPGHRGGIAEGPFGRLPDFGIEGGPGIERSINGVDLAELANFLGTTEDDLEAEFRDGKNIVEIAEDHGKTVEELRAFLIEQATSAIDERLQEASESNSDSSEATPTPTV